MEPNPHDALRPSLHLRTNRRTLLGSTVALAGLALGADRGIAHEAPPTVATPVAGSSLTAAVTRLDALIREKQLATGIPGIAVGVVAGTDVAFLQNYGVREAGSDQAIDRETMFQIASLSKPIASTIVAGLVGDGVCGWDDPIIRHDPTFALSDPWLTDAVTIRDLLCHRSGLPEFAGDRLGDLGFSRSEILSRLRYYTPVPFRARYAYTNYGFTEGALAAAAAADKRWEAIATLRLYAPAGMTRTTSRNDYLLVDDNRARLHVRENDRWVARYERNVDAQAPANGVSSSASDLCRWMILQLNQGMLDGQQIIAPEPLAETQHPVIVSIPPVTSADEHAAFYGLGWNVGYDSAGRVRLSHSGAFFLGAGTSVMLSPATGIGVVVLTNAQPIGFAEAVCATFLDEVLDDATGFDWFLVYERIFAAFYASHTTAPIAYDRPPATPSAALPTAAYVGTYQNRLYGDAVVSRTGADGLVIALGPAPLEFGLTHYDRDIFTYQPTGEFAFSTPSGVRFDIAPGEIASGLVIDQFNQDGQGSFIRMNAAVE